MPEPSSGRTRPSLLERISAALLRTPDDRDQLIQLLRRAQDRDLLDAEATSMIEGVLQVAELTAGDIMVPRARMDVVDVAQPLSEIVSTMIRTAHSRFPVVDGDRDRILGVLHAKDLLRLQAGQAESLRALLRPAPMIPESKRLNVLLRDFRENRSHLAIVVDEYGGVAGLITIEDVLEQIVGEIEDEFDLDDGRDHIVELEPGPEGPRWRVPASAPLEAFDERVGSALADAGLDTVGGLVAARIGRVPRRGDTVDIAGLRFEVLRATPRRVLALRVERLQDARVDA
ncbi:MAG TPA: CBS domain-containing protein [Burkholderiaceae bacterium]|nr:CBS domain-containing protein [Burkholderiaceae bacterium]